MNNTISDAERKVVGYLAFIFCFVSVAFASALVIALAVGVHVPIWVFTAGLLAAIIVVALQFPLWLFLAEAAGDRFPDGKRNLLRPQVHHPFWLFEFWWRYVR